MKSEAPIEHSTRPSTSLGLSMTLNLAVAVNGMEVEGRRFGFWSWADPVGQ